MSMNDAFLLIIGGIFLPCIIIVFGIPFNYIIFWLLKKCGVLYKKWVMHLCAIVAPLVIAILCSCWSIYYVFHHEYWDDLYTLDGVEIPVKVTNVEFPPAEGDDCTIIKQFEITRGGLTPSLVSQLDSLSSQSDTSHWTKTGATYQYIDFPWNNRLIVTIDSINATGVFEYFKF